MTSKSKFNPSGRILWEGLSKYDQKPIVCIITGLGSTKSQNPKTGEMHQTFILRQDIPPNEGFKNGENRSICGNCPHAGWNNGSCYIKWFQSPLAVWKCYRRNRYKKFSNDDLKYLEGSALRLGSAGDPAMIPISVFKPLLDRCKTHTGYTHQWMHEWAEDYKGICQASCDGLIQYVEASSHGWKCFSVKHKDSPAPKGSINCPASEEQGKTTQCSLCSLCDGQTSNVFINAHGNTAKRVPIEA